MTAVPERCGLEVFKGGESRHSVKKSRLCVKDLYLLFYLNWWLQCHSPQGLWTEGLCFWLVPQQVSDLWDRHCCPVRWGATGLTPGAPCQFRPPEWAQTTSRLPPVWRFRQTRLSRPHLPKTGTLLPLLTTPLPLKARWQTGWWHQTVLEAESVGPRTRSAPCLTKMTKELAISIKHILIKEVKAQGAY